MVPEFSRAQVPSRCNRGWMWTGKKWTTKVILSTSSCTMQIKKSFASSWGQRTEITLQSLLSNHPWDGENHSWCYVFDI